MQLSSLIADLVGVRVIGAVDGIEITQVTMDSREVIPGALFCCVPGTISDGHRFLGEAVNAGALAVVTEHDHDGELSGCVELRVATGIARRTASLLAGIFEGNPSARLTMVGVTGTNGKTTVAQMVGAILASEGGTVEVLGTLSGARTTPPAPELQRRLASIVRDADERGDHGAAVMEVSSHALDQDRVAGIVFEVAAFTNLSHDHLDYHRTMESYFAAKAKLFLPESAKSVVIWGEDPFGQELLALRHDAVAVTWGDASEIALSIEGSTFTWRGHDVKLSLIGRFNIANALVSLETAVSLGVDPERAAAALSFMGSVDGRMERVGTTVQGASIFVDYAHTPEALEKVIREIREVIDLGKRVILVFGCGGDRDQEKRPLMGKVAAHYADIAIVTTDNPRGEKASEITQEIMRGALGLGDVREIPDRREAIIQALSMATTGDAVIIAGKGHESTQIIGDVITPFDDRAVARALLGGVS